MMPTLSYLIATNGLLPAPGSCVNQCSFFARQLKDKTVSRFTIDDAAKSEFTKDRTKTFDVSSCCDLRPDTGRAFYEYLIPQVYFDDCEAELNTKPNSNKLRQYLHACSDVGLFTNCVSQSAISAARDLAKNINFGTPDILRQLELQASFGGETLLIIRTTIAVAGRVILLPQCVYVPIDHNGSIVDGSMKLDSPVDPRKPDIERMGSCQHLVRPLLHWLSHRESKSKSA